MAEKIVMDWGDAEDYMAAEAAEAALWAAMKAVEAEHGKEAAIEFLMEVG